MASLAEWRSGRAPSVSVGVIATVSVHALALLLLITNRPITIAKPAVLNARIFVDASTDSSSAPVSLHASPEMSQPQTQLALPIFISAAPAIATQSVAISSHATPIRSESQQNQDSLPRFDVDYLDNPLPHYPPQSRRLREQGIVLLRVFVLSSGLPDSIELKQSSGSRRLDESALDVVKRWKFVPANRGGQPIACWVVVPIAFSLAA